MTNSKVKCHKEFDLQIKALLRTGSGLRKELAWQSEAGRLKRDLPARQSLW